MPPPTQKPLVHRPQNLALWKEIQEAPTPEIKNQKAWELVLANTGILRLMVRHSRRTPYKDLRQMAYLSLFKAARDVWDPEKGGLVRVALWAFYKDLKMMPARHGIKVSCYSREGVTKIRKALYTSFAKGKRASLRQLAESVRYGGLDDEESLAVLWAAVVPPFEQTEFCRVSSKEKYHQPVAEPRDHEHEKDLDRLSQIMGTLPPRTQYILRSRVEEKTLNEIGEDLWISRERVRQLELKGMQLVKKLM